VRRRPSGLHSRKEEDPKPKVESSLYSTGSSSYRSDVSHATRESDRVALNTASIGLYLTGNPFGTGIVYVTGGRYHTLVPNSLDDFAPVLYANRCILASCLH